MNPENERDKFHCDCGKPKAPGETMCRPCATGGFPPDDSQPDGYILIDWCPLCGHDRSEHGIHGCRACGCKKQSSAEQQHRDEERRRRERKA